jgi:hypothetical protein
VTKRKGALIYVNRYPDKIEAFGRLPTVFLPNYLKLFGSEFVLRFT